MLQDGDRIGAADTVPVENFMRQIEPSATGVLIEIAEDIGQLQGSTERFSDGMGSTALITEDMDREMADGAGDTRTIEVERRKIGGANCVARIHFHPVDYGVEIAAAEVIAQHRLTQRPREVGARTYGQEPAHPLSQSGEG